MEINILRYYLEEEGMEISDENISDVEDGAREANFITEDKLKLQFLIEAIIHWFLNDEVLKEDHEYFSRAGKQQGEDE